MLPCILIPVGLDVGMEKRIMSNCSPLGRNYHVVFPACCVPRRQCLQLTAPPRPQQYCVCECSTSCEWNSLWLWLFSLTGNQCWTSVYVLRGGSCVCFVFHRVPNPWPTFLHWILSLNTISWAFINSFRHKNLAYQIKLANTILLLASLSYFLIFFDVKNCNLC